MKTPLLAEPSRSLLGALLDTARLWAARISWTLSAALSWLKSSTRILWFELCTLAPRMTIARAAIRGLPQGVLDPRDLGPLFEPGSAPEGLVPCRRTDARTLDAEHLQTMYPWATEADQWMFFLGWERGEAYACGSQHRKETEAVTSSVSSL